MSVGWTAQKRGVAAHTHIVCYIAENGLREGGGRTGHNICTNEIRKKKIKAYKSSGNVGFILFKFRSF